jgi:hypothetical protein
MRTVYVEKRLRKSFSVLSSVSLVCERDVSVKMAPSRVANCDWI